MAVFIAVVETCLVCDDEGATDRGRPFSVCCVSGWSTVEQRPLTMFERYYTPTLGGNGPRLIATESGQLLAVGHFSLCVSFFVFFPGRVQPPLRVPTRRQPAGPSRCSCENPNSSGGKTR